MSTKISKNLDNNYCCKLCDFNTCKLTDYNRHLVTQKHVRNESATSGNKILEKTLIYVKFVRKNIIIDLVYGDIKINVIKKKNKKKKKIKKKNNQQIKNSL